MPELDYAWNVIKDFSPGIHQRLSSDYPAGTASPLNTYRCYAVEGGALSPLPARRTAAITKDPLIPADTNLAEEFRIIGLHAANPMFWPTETIPGLEQNNTEIFLATEHWSSASSTPGAADNSITQSVARYFRHYQYSPSWQEVWSASASTPYSPRIRPRHTQFATGRSNTSNSTQAGPIVVVWVTSGHARQFPDETNPSALSTVALPGDKEDAGNPSGLISPDTLLLHQDRVVIFPLTLSSFGPTTISTTNECFYYSNKNDLRTLASELSGLYFNFPPSNENPNGYGVAASLTYNECLLIKSKGGAIVLHGDMAVFSARTLPYVRGTGLSMNNGSVSPLGYTYPTDGGGVWLWNGGDVSQHLTKHLKPEFWRPPATSIDGTSNEWGYHWSQATDANNWVVFPNNWMWDTDLGGWWRLDDPDDVVFHRATTDWRSHFMWCSPSGYRDASDPVLYEYNLTQPAADYSWQSQPLSVSMDRVFNIRDVQVVATGLGSIRLTVTSRENPNGAECTFQSTSDSTPDLIRGTLSNAISGTHITFRVEAHAPNPDDPAGAPLIHEIRYATQDSHHIRR
jgi:hypothetical protein